MSLEAVQKVAETEKQVQQRKADATAQAKKLLADAERAGQEKLKVAREAAQAQAKDMMLRAERSAAEHALTVEQETQADCNDLRKAAEGRLEDAAALIIRRVVDI